MALFKPYRGNRAALDSIDKHDGYAYFCMDDGTFHIDYVDSEGNLQRKQINAKEAEALAGYNIATVLNSSDSEIPTSKAVKDMLDSYIYDENDAMELISEMGLIEPAADENGAVYTDENGVIYTL